jgi:hypothetical protein
MTTEIMNTEEGEPITRINVMRVMTYDVETIVQQLREDNRAGKDEELEITLDDVLERVQFQAEADFAYYETSDLIYQDEHGNDY